MSSDHGRDTGTGARAGPRSVGVDGDGPWAVTGAGRELLAVYEPFRDGVPSPRSCCRPRSAE